MVKIDKNIINKKTHKSAIEKKMMGQAMKIVMSLIQSKVNQIIAMIVILFLFTFSVIGIIGTIHYILN